MAGKQRQQGRRRGWQRLCRAALLVGLALIAAYVTLPWWLPTGVLRRWITSDLSRQMKVPVTISSLSVSWSGGVEIEHLRIESEERFGPEPIVHVARIRADFSPIDFLFRRRLAWVEVYEPRLTVKFDERGNASPAPLTRVSKVLEIERISVHRAAAIVHFHGQKGNLRLNVSDLQYVAGRLAKFGRMTMSADLDQGGKPAPVGLQMAAVDNDEAVAAAATFNFTQVDVHQLALVRLLALPLRRLGGRCGGSLKLRLNHEGVVDHFEAHLILHELEIQPLAGPKLPVIPEANFDLSARYDPFPGEDASLTVHKAEVRLPGRDGPILDLSGEAELYGAASLRWQSIKSLHFTGRADCNALTAMLTGRGRLPGGIRVDRPIALTVWAGESVEDETLRGDNGNALPLRVSIDASDAAIFRGARLAKCAGTPLRIEFAAGVDRDDTSVKVEGGQIKLGENKFLGSGSVDNLGQRLDRWSGPDAVRTLPHLWAELQQTEWEGTWEISELASLRPLLGLGQDTRMWARSGRVPRISGGWSLVAHGQRLAAVNFNVPADTGVQIGPFRKPVGKPMSVTFAANLDAPNAALTGLWAEAQIGAARASLLGGEIRLLPGRAGHAGDLAVDFSGQFEAERVEELLACAALPRWAKRLAGGVRGSGSLRLGSGAVAGYLTADLTRLAVRCGRWLRKDADQPMTLTAGFVDDASATDSRVSAHVRCPQAALDVHAALPAARRAGAPVAARARLAVHDAAWLAATCPELPERLSALRLAGGLVLTAAGTHRPGEGSLDVHLDATDLAYISSDRSARVKAAGERLEAWLRGRFSLGADEAVTARLTSAGVRAGGSSLRFSGRAVLKPAKGPAGERLYPPPGLVRFRGEAGASLTLDGTLKRLLPELARTASDHGLSGTLTATAEIGGNDERAWLDADVDATDLSAEALGSAVLSGPQPKAHWQRVEANCRGPLIVEKWAGDARLHERLLVGPFAKPRGLPARAHVQLTYVDGPSLLVLNDLFIRAGGVEVLASASAPVRHAPGAVPLRLDNTSGHVAVRTADAGALARLLPALASYELAGGALIEAEWRKTGPRRLTHVSVHADKLRGRFRRRDVQLDGGFVLGDVELGPHAPARAATFRTDGLSFVAGGNRGWLTAELRGLPDEPAGTFTLSASALDDRELSALLGPQGATPTTQPLVLTGSEVAALAERAKAVLARLRPRALDADLRGRVRVGSLRALDASVGRSYTARNVAVDLVADHGNIKIDYDAGLNGGTLRRRLEVDLNDSAAMVASKADLINVLASEDFQPQLAKHFPGNTYRGLFTRREEVQISLVNFVANAMDARFPLRPVGTATTVTTEGTIRGRAAPKWMTGIFPGLELTEYNYNKMTSLATYRADGTAENEMVFDGRTYDLHIEGTTDADNRADYTVGLLLLGSPRTGRGPPRMEPISVPLLEMTARIEGGKMHDQRIRYFSYKFITGILIKNNIRIVTGIISEAYRAFLLAGNLLFPIRRPAEEP